MPNSMTKNLDPKGKIEEGAKEVGHQIAEKADDATAAAGRGIQTAADAIRDNTPDKGVVGAAAKAVADTVDQGGKYLEQQQLSGMLDDMGEIIRKNPVPTLLIAVGVGFLLARAMSRS